MAKRTTDNQILGELGETAVKKIVLETGFIYEHRGRLEAGRAKHIHMASRRDAVSSIR